MNARKKANQAPRAMTTKKSGRRAPARSGGAASRRRTSWVGIGAGIVVLVFIALVVVSTTRSTSGRASSSAAQVASAAPGGGGPGSPVTPFTLTSISGQHVSVPRAGRPGVVFFTVSSCTSCIPTAQSLSTVKSQLGSRVDVVMVDLDPGDTPGNLAAWGGMVGHPAYPLAIDTTGNLAGAYQVQYLGTTIFYNAQGHIVARSAEPSMNDIEQGVRKAGVSL